MNILITGKYLMVKFRDLHKWIPLVLLTVAGFTFNTSELMPIGLLSDIACDFGIGEARTGLLISIYAWFVALLSLPLTLYFAHTDFRKLMLWIVAVFVMSHVGSVLAQGYWSLMVSRIGVACAHSIFWSIAPTMAIEVTPGKVRSTALSVMVAGGGIALVAGLPIGRMIGLVAGWRMSFALLGVLAFLLFIGLRHTLPSLPQDNRDESRKDIIRDVVTCRPLLMIYIITVMLVTGHYTGYSYVEPFLDQVAGMKPQAITATLSLFGFSGLLGSFIMGKYYRRYPLQIISCACSGLSVIMLLLYPASSAGVWIVAGCCVLWGLCITFFNIAFQNGIVTFSPKNSAVAMSIYSGIFNLGIGLGAFVGGRVCEHGDIAYIGYFGGVIALCAAIYAFFRYLPRLRQILHNR